MKYKILSVGADTEKVPSINIGDYIQALAASQYLPQIDGFIDRDDELYCYDDEECKMIMNGWFMHKPQNWPPSGKIHPLFVAFHINNSYIDYFNTESSLTYLKKYEPIGCRDTHTLHFLEANKIDAYFSGCLTLTLGYKFKSERKNNKIYFVDPYICYKPNILMLTSFFMHIITSFSVIRKIAKKMLPYRLERNSFTRFIGAAFFYSQYKKLFGKEALLTAEYRAHIRRDYSSNYPSRQLLLNEAERLVSEYAQAKMVITSRIHCGLPCLGLETKVLFVRNKNIDSSNASRLDGLTDLFNVIFSNKGSLIFPDGNIHIVQNKDTWRPYAHDLMEKCMNFISE